MEKACCVWHRIFTDLSLDLFSPQHEKHQSWEVSSGAVSLFLLLNLKLHFYHHAAALCCFFATDVSLDVNASKVIHWWDEQRPNRWSVMVIRCKRTQMCSLECEAVEMNSIRESTNCLWMTLRINRPLGSCQSLSQKQLCLPWKDVKNCIRCTFDAFASDQIVVFQQKDNKML